MTIDAFEVHLSLQLNLLKNERTNEVSVDFEKSKGV